MTMATRRSARIRNPNVTVPTETPAPAPSKPTAKKRKAEAPPAKAPVAVKKKKAATPAGTKAENAKDAKLQPQLSPGDATLSTLSGEVLQIIFDHIDDAPTIGKLCRTCKLFHSIMIPRLHKRVAVTTRFHVHITNIIQMIQPYLSIAQKKKLKREGNYKGQQEQLPSVADVDAKPQCADYVRELVVGTIDPGKKHEYIVYRYLEEATRSMENLELVEMWKLTSSLAKHVVALKNLKALSLVADTVKNKGDITPLAEVKNLQHFQMRRQGHNIISDEFQKITRSIVFNSRLTLRSLSMVMEGSGFSFLQDWDKKVDPGTRGPDFPALRSLQLTGINWDDPNFVHAFKRSFNLMGLESLSLERIFDGRNDLFRYLADSAATTQNEDIKLQRLKIEASGLSMIDYHIDDDMDRICGFLNSFDSLTSIHFAHFNQHSYPRPDIDNTREDVVQKAILKHKNLRILVLRVPGYGGLGGDPYVSTEFVAAMVEGLPWLEEFRFVVDETEIAGIADILSRGKNLTTIQFDILEEDKEIESQLSEILRTLMDKESSNVSEAAAFRWEDHSKLRRILINCTKTYEIASGFEKPKAGSRMSKPMRVVSSLHKDREVWFRDIRQSLIPKDVQYVHRSGWADEAACDLSWKRSQDPA